MLTDQLLETLTEPIVIGRRGSTPGRFSFPRGIDVARFQTQVGLDPLELYCKELATFAAQGLLEFDSRRIRLTPAGRLVADRIIGELLCDDSPDAGRSPLRVLPT